MALTDAQVRIIEARIHARVRRYFREAAAEGGTIAEIRKRPAHVAGVLWMRVYERVRRRFPVRGDGT